MQKSELQNLINWNAVLEAPRYAGGHQEVMSAIFEGNSKILDHYTENDYQGQLAIAYEFSDGSVVIITDYFGSCGGCDAWEDACDGDVRTMVTSLVNSARLFDGIEEARNFCKSEKTAEDYPFDAAINLSF
jgi:hypothetical protein